MYDDKADKKSRGEIEKESEESVSQRDESESEAEGESEAMSGNDEISDCSSEKQSSLTQTA